MVLSHFYICSVILIFSVLQVSQLVQAESKEQFKKDYVTLPPYEFGINNTFQGGNLEDADQIIAGVKIFDELVGAIASYGGEEGSAIEIIADLTSFADFAIDLAYTGYFTTLTNQVAKIQQQQHIVMDKLTDIGDQIKTLGIDMGKDLQKLMNLIDQESCFITYQRYEQTLISASIAYQMYLKYKDTASENQFKQAFLQACNGYKCDTAVQAFLAVLDGNEGLMGCDLMDLLYKGAPAGSYYIGWRDFLVSKTAYLISLTSQGIVHISAYYTLTCTSNCSIVPTNIHQQYYPSLYNVLGRLPWYDQYCNTYIISNSRANVKGTMQQIGELSVKDTAMHLFSVLYKVYPWKNWLVDVTTQGNQLQRCSDCFVLWASQYNGQYNILVAFMDKNTSLPNPVLFSPHQITVYENIANGGDDYYQYYFYNEIQGYINDNDIQNINDNGIQNINDNGIQNVENYLLQNLCSLNIPISGIHIIGRENRIWNVVDFFDPNWWQYWGDKYLIIIWFGNEPFRYGC